MSSSNVTNPKKEHETGALAPDSARAQCTVSPLHALRFLASRIFAGCILVGSVLGGVATPVVSGETEAKKPLVLDLRRQPISPWAKNGMPALKDGRAVPLFDENYVREQIRLLVDPVSSIYSAGGFIGINNLGTNKPLTYHVVARLEIQDVVGPERWASYAMDMHWPARSTDRQKGDDAWSRVYLNDPHSKHKIDGQKIENNWSSTEKFVQAVGKPISKALSRLEKLLGVRPEADTDKADILIHINLADSKQTSRGFNLEDLPTYQLRSTSSAHDKEIEQQIFALPWTIIRQYNVQHPKVKWQRMPVGGEVWIQYPIRTFWQEQAAIYLLSDLRLPKQFGLGADRADVARKFVAPHEANLRPLLASIFLPRPRWPRAPRPGETLLSFATSGVQNYPRGFSQGQHSYFDDLIWSGTKIGETIGLRLLRAVSIITLSRRMGAHLIAPNGDYGAGFLQDPSEFLADLSLQPYPKYFDVRFHDRMAPLLLDEMWMAHGQRHTHKLPSVGDYNEKKKLGQEHASYILASRFIKTQSNSILGALTESAADANYNPENEFLTLNWDLESWFGEDKAKKIHESIRPFYQSVP